ncbi:MAG: CDP-alcohol phosphatidyltransferase family protein [Candidatus Helarchaeota archaeon]
MVSNRLRNFSEKYMKPIAKLADKLHITPNTCTLLGLIMALLSGLFIVLSNLPIFNIPLYRWLFLLAASMFLLASGFFDILDGVLARYQKSSTIFGGFLDSVLDRYSDAIIISAIIIAGYCNIIIGLIALMGSIFVSYSRARAESSGVPSKYMAAGIAERMERMLLIALLIYFEQSFYFLNVLGLMAIPAPLTGILGILFPNLIGTAITILACITHATVIHRIYIAYNRLPKTKLDAEGYERERERIRNESQKDN